MKYLLFFLLLTSLISCDLDLPEEAFDESAAAVPMEELNIPQGFGFSTTRTVQLNVSARDANGITLRNVPFEVLLPDGESLLVLQTASTGTSGTAQLMVALPNAAADILVKTPYLGLPAEKLVSVGTSAAVDIVLGEENQEGFVGGGEDMQFLQGNSGSSTVAANPSEAVGSRGAVTFSYLGTYSNTGRPNYLVSPNDVVSQEVLEVINASLPENQPVPTYHPEYLDNDLVSTVNLVEDAEVWVTFVHEGAGYRNALGYYTYPTETPPATVDDIESLKIVFPNTSYQGSGGSLVTGNKVYLGSFTAGTSVGWFLVPDGWNSTTKLVDVKPGIKFADKNLNTFTQAQYRQHVALLYDQSLQKLILGMEDIDRPGGDNDFNDAIFYVSANPFTAIETGRLAAAVNTDDNDEDGVSNSVDVAPDDPNIAFYAYTPAQGQFATLAFEDLFPRKGDYDMNDLVVDYNFKEYLNANNEIVKMDVALELRAAGGVQENGFGFEMGVAPNKVASVTGFQINGNLGEILSPNGVEFKQSKAVVIAFDQSLTLLGGDKILNTEKERGSVNPVSFNMTIQFTAPVTRQELGVAPFNPFMFVDGLRGKEVHLPGHRPTSLANAAFFGSGDDVTDPSNGVFYQTATGLPFAINVPVSFDYPVERAPINAGHLKFTQWAQSGGSAFTDWYKNKNGYRAVSKVY
jgi:LruC domain-containing protein